MTLSTKVAVWEDVCPPALRRLADEHRRILTEDSGIDPDIVERRGYHTLTQAQVIELVNLEVLPGYALKASGWLSIPILKPDGTKHGEIVRLFGYTGTFKYLWPLGERLAMDVHPYVLHHRDNPEIPILITEGIKKADALLSAARREGYACLIIALNGCYGWRATVGKGTMALSDFHDINWAGRKVYVISDSDFRTNDNVAKGWSECALYVGGKTGEHKTTLVVVPQEGTEKIGADDYLSAGHTLSQLLSHAETLTQARARGGEERTPLRVKTGIQLMKDAGEQIPHLIDPLIPERSIVLLAGHSGTFKTWNALGLALDGAFGFPWTEHPSLKQRVPFTTLYVNKEMSGLILGQRLKMFVRNTRYSLIPDWEKLLEERIIFSDEAALDLNIEGQRARLEDAILSSSAKLVVLDSLSMCWHGDENSASEVGAFYTELRGIIERTGSSWLPLHHLLKPQAGKNKQNPIFSVRGSGQLIQQADAAILLEHYDGENAMGESPTEKLITASHIKARTSVELPPWLLRFSTNDGLFADIRYLANVTEAKARSLAKASGDPTRLREWLVAEFVTMPGMAPTGSGMRFKPLVTLLQQNWTVEGKDPPSESSIRRQLQALTDTGELVLVTTDKKNGDLFRLPDPEDAPSREPTEPTEPDEEPTS